MTVRDLSLVIFDCDGVLVDSEPLANRALQQNLERLGLSMTYEEVRQRFLGLSWARVCEIIEEMLGRPLPEGWLEDQRAHDRALFKAHLQPIPGVRDVVETVRARGLSYCVASSGEVDKMQFTLGLTGLLPLFEDVLFSATMVTRGKPHPDLFLLAAERMGQAPEHCAVIEDSVNGVTGARAAGMTVYAFAGDPMADRSGLEKAGGLLFDRMADLPGLLGLEA